MLEQIKSLGHGGQGLDGLAKVITELQGLTISGPLTGVASGTAIAVTGIETQDTVLKALEFVSGVPEDRTADVTIVDRRASATLTLASVVAGNTAVVHGKTYTCVAFTKTPSNGRPDPYSFALGATDAETAANLAAEITAQDPLLVASAASDVVTIYARAAGTGGNSITIGAVSGTITKSGNLAGGTATNAIKIANDTTGNTVLLFWYKKSRVVGQA